MAWFGKTTLLVYGEKIVAYYKIHYENDNDCEIELNLYHPFNRHKAILEHIKLSDIDNAVLDYMNLQAYCDTEDCNKLYAYEVVEYFKKGRCE